MTRPNSPSGSVEVLRAARTGLCGLLILFPLLPEGRVPPPVYPILAAFPALLALSGRARLAAHLRPLVPLLPFPILCGLSIALSPSRLAGWPDQNLLLAHLFGILAATLSTNKKEQVVRLLQCALLPGVLIAGLGIAQYYRWAPPGLETRYYGRITATFSNPNHLGAYLACLLPLSPVLVVCAGRPAARRLWACAAVLVYTALFLTASRGGWWSAVLAFCILGLGTWRSGLIPAIRPAFKPLGAAFAACALSTLLYSLPTPAVVAPEAPSMPERLARTPDLFAPRVEGRNSVGHRRLIWNTTLDIIHDHPLLGIGYGAFASAYPAYRDARLENDPAFRNLAPGMQRENTRYAHNDYLQLWAESGPLTLLVFLGGCALLLRPGNRADVCLLRLAILSAAAALLSHSLVSYPLRLHAPGLLLWVALGLLNSPALRGR